MPIASSSLYAIARYRHQYLFACSRKPQDADVENGSPSLPDLKLIEPLQMTMDDIVTSSCEELVSVLRRSITLTAGGEGTPSL